MVGIEAGEINAGDSLYIIGSSTGVVEVNPEKILCDDAEIKKAVKGMDITFECADRVRENDKVYLIKKINK